MADDTDDVIELVDEIEDLETEDEQTDGDVEDDEGEETAPGFSDEEAAPASEGDSSVIRDLRKANRELAKKISAYERSNQPQKIELGPKPTLASCDYDEERFETELDQWKAQEAKAAEQDRELESRREAAAKRDEEIVQAYKASRTALKVADYDEAEDAVEAALPPPVMNLLIRHPKSAELLYALSKSPERLATLSKLDPSTGLVEAAFMLGELGAKLTMQSRRTQSPERRISGSAPLSSGRPDKELARLEKEAERTGDRTALIRFRKKLKAQA